MQQETNRADAQVCGACFRYVGTVGAQIARNSSRPRCETQPRRVASTRVGSAPAARRGDASRSRGVRRARPARNRHEPRDDDDAAADARRCTARPVRFASLARARRFLASAAARSRGRRRGVARFLSSADTNDTFIGREGAAFGRDARGRDARGSEGRRARRRRFRRGVSTSDDARRAGLGRSARRVGAVLARPQTALVGPSRARTTSSRVSPSHSSGRACARSRRVAGSAGADCPEALSLAVPGLFCARRSRASWVCSS